MGDAVDAVDEVEAAAHRQGTMFHTLEQQLRAFAVKKALHTCDQLLALLPGDQELLRVKVRAELHKEGYAEALALLSGDPSLAAALPLERAYCLYRLNRHAEALALLQSAQAAPEWAAGAAHLTAQLQYRLGANQEAVCTYEDALKARGCVRASQGALTLGVTPQAGLLESQEARTNLVAAYISAGRSAEVPALLAQLGIEAADGYAPAYNAACACLGQGQLGEARRLLLSAQRLGREELGEEELGEEELRGEMLSVEVQLAHLAALQGRPREAAEALARLLRLKGTDAGSAAVAANNLVACRGSHELCDSLKRLERLLERGGGGAGGEARLAEALETRLGGGQKRAVHCNHATLLLLANKREPCRQLLGALAAQCPGDALPLLLQAALLLRDRRAAQAEELLAAAPQPDVRVHLMRAQLAALSGEGGRCIALLRALPAPLRCSPALVATLVALLEAQGGEGAAEAEALLDEALAHWEARLMSEGGGKEEEAAQAVSQLLRAAADCKAARGRHPEAVALFERLLRGARGEGERAAALQGLVRACSGRDLAAAERYAELLAAARRPAAQLDAEELDSSPQLGAPGPATATAAAEPAPGRAEADAQQRKRRKRQPRYPAGFDPAAPGNPAPDPERWLPKRERAAHKSRAKKAKAQALRGSQGSTAPAAPVAPTPPPPPPSGKKGRR